MILELGPYKLYVDAVKTRSANTLVTPTNRNCKCNVCQNFTPAIQKADKVVLDLFTQFGLDPKRPSEVMEYEVKGDVMHCGGYYHIVGQILEISVPEWIDESHKIKQQNPARVMEISDSFSIAFSKDCVLVPSAFSVPVFQMEIYCKLPWVLDYIPDQEFPKELTQKVDINFATLIDKKTIQGLGSVKFKMKFDIDSKTVELIVEEQIFNRYELEWFGIITYRKSKLLYACDIRDA